MENTRVSHRDPSVLTTGEVARMLSISQPVVIRCCKDGSLKNWLIPMSRQRRINRADLLAFAAAHNIPVREVA